MQYDGLRFRAECRLAGKVYGQPFGVDVAFGDPILGEPDVVAAEDLLAFAGIAPPQLRLYPVATHVAEKLHAHTTPGSVWSVSPDFSSFASLSLADLLRNAGRPVAQSPIHPLCLNGMRAVLTTDAKPVSTLPLFWTGFEVLPGCVLPRTAAQ